MKYLSKQCDAIQERLDKLREFDSWFEKIMEDIGPDWECSLSLQDFLFEPSINIILRYKMQFDAGRDKSKSIIQMSASIENPCITLISVYVKAANDEKTIKSSNRVHCQLSKMSFTNVPFIVELIKTIPSICDEENPMALIEKRLLEYEKKQNIDKDFKE